MAWGLITQFLNFHLQISTPIHSRLILQLSSTYRRSGHSLTNFSILPLALFPKWRILGEVRYFKASLRHCSPNHSLHSTQSDLLIFWISFGTCQGSARLLVNLCNLTLSINCEELSSVFRLTKAVTSPRHDWKPLFRAARPHPPAIYSSLVCWVYFEHR